MNPTTFVVFLMNGQALLPEVGFAVRAARQILEERPARRRTKRAPRCYQRSHDSLIHCPSRRDRRPRDRHDTPFAIQFP